MSDQNRKELLMALEQKGWSLLEEYPAGDGLSGVWKIQRSTRRPSLYIDFPGYGGMGEDIPIEKTYACYVRDHNLSLYFYRPNRSKNKWREELTAFVNELDKMDNG